MIEEIHNKTNLIVIMGKYILGNLSKTAQLANHYYMKQWKLKRKKQNLCQLNSNKVFLGNVFLQSLDNYVIYLINPYWLLV